MKQITVKDEQGTQYILEFTKATIIQMEKAGFVLDEVDKMPVTMMTLLVQGAFKAHHSMVSAEKIESIYASLANKEKLLTKLAEMYAEHADKLVEEGNVSWEANF